ncbi:MAG: hypothetical protein DRP60_12900 [Spirochaetes bacterium]|nr:MAG: hypothetical protein DRP60_12900 [Spirochaetota bacterium]
MKHRTIKIIMIILAAVIFNNIIQLLGEFVFTIPFYFDSMFTIAVGIFFGWIPGLITGLLTNLGMELTHSFHGLSGPFAVVNMASGVIAGLIAADKDKYWSLSRQIYMILALTTANVLLGAYIVNVLFGGLTGSPPDILVSALLLMGQNQVLATIMARIPINLVDKGLPVLVIFIGYRIFQSRKKKQTG